MKIVFTDIDGVLNGGYNRDLGGRSGFDWCLPKAVANLNTITEMTGAVIVISSSWRLEESVEQITATFRKWGVTGQVIGATPEVSFEDPDCPGVHLPDARIFEIRSWLRDSGFEIDGFVVLDDNDITLDVNNTIRNIPEIESRFILTDTRKGLTENEVREALELLR